jgi:uncharacterized protein YkuJ
MMDIQTFTELQKSSSTIPNGNIEQLEEIVASYPYFQLANALLLKGLKQNENYKFNKALKLTAAVTIDRSVLFDYISNFSFSESNPSKKGTKVEVKEIETKSFLKENLKIGSPLDFNKNEAYSFNQWLQLTNKKGILRETKTNSSLFKNIDLIDRFIDENPTIKPISKDVQSNTQAENSYTEKELMTETLAKVYLAQKKYSNAIKAYDILILKYPEKSGFFADQIKKIELLKK